MLYYIIFHIHGVLGFWGFGVLVVVAAAAVVVVVLVDLVVAIAGVHVLDPRPNTEDSKDLRF